MDNSYYINIKEKVELILSEFFEVPIESDIQIEPLENEFSLDDDDLEDLKKIIDQNFGCESLSTEIDCSWTVEEIILHIVDNL